MGRVLCVLQRRWMWICAAVLGVTVVLAARRSWLPLGDNALMQMWTDAVGGRHTPLVGGDSRFGWNHLGPWPFYVMAAVSLLCGHSGVALLIGAGAVNIVSLVVIGRCVRSVTTGGVAAIVCSATLFFLATADQTRLIDPWNPYIAQLPFLLAVVACWAVLNRRLQWFPWLVGAGSWSVQAHIEYLPPVVLLLVAATSTVVRQRSAIDARTRRAAAVAACLAWIPAVIDLVLPRRHNLARVVAFLLRPSTGPSARLGVRLGVRVVLHETGLSGSWIAGNPPVSIFDAGFHGSVGFAPGIALVGLGVTAAVAWRRRDRVIGTLCALLAALLGVGIAEVAGAPGPLYPYLFGWVTLAGMLCCLLPVISLLRNHDAAVQRLPMGALPIAFSLLVATLSWMAPLPRSPLERESDAGVVRSLVAASRPLLDRHQRYHLLHGDDAFNSIYELGVASALRRDGVDVVVTPDEVVLFGRHMIDSRAVQYPLLLVVAPFDGAAPGDVVLAQHDPLSPAERHEELDLTHRLFDIYSSEGRADVADLIGSRDERIVGLAPSLDEDAALRPEIDRLVALRKRGRSVAIVLRDPPTAS